MPFGISLRGANFNPTIDASWKNFKTDYGAVGDGLTSDSCALNSWLADATATKLYMPPTPGSFYHLPGANTLTAGKGTAMISAYGATVDNAWIGPVGAIVQDQNHSARTVTAPSGATSVVLINSSRSTIFSSGSWVLMTGLAIQDGGYPPDWQFFEYKVVQSVSGGTITFDSPLKYTYSSGWIDLNGGDGGGASIDAGGPAMLVALTSAWDTDVTIYGLTATSTIVTAGGRNVFLANCNFTGSVGCSPSICKSIVLHGGYVGFQPEVDKLLARIEYRQCRAGNNISFASANDELVLHNVSLPNVLDGTAKNTTIQGGSSFAVQIRCGPTGQGAGNSIYADNASWGGAVISGARLPIASLTWVGSSDGTWSIPSTAADWPNFISVFVPGQKIAFCFFAGGTILNSTTGAPVTFTCNNVRASSNTLFADTDIGPTQPAPTYPGGGPANYLINWAANTNGITQVNSGPSDITQFAAH